MWIWLSPRKSLVFQVRKEGISIVPSSISSSQDPAPFKDNLRGLTSSYHQYHRYSNPTHSSHTNTTTVQRYMQATPLASLHIYDMSLSGIVNVWPKALHVKNKQAGATGILKWTPPTVFPTYDRHPHLSHFYHFSFKAELKKSCTTLDQFSIESNHSNV